MRQQTPLLRLLGLLFLVTIAGAPFVAAQTDVTRQTIAITYPLDQSVKVRLRGTTIQPRLEGDVEAKRTGRSGTKIKLSIRNLTRAAELGNIYTVYVLWAISPESVTDNLGEIKRGGSALTESKLEVTSRLPTFALIVTAEPHSLVTRPSRMVIMENLRPAAPFLGEVQPFTLPLLGNSSDEFRERAVPGLPTAEDYDKTPVSLLGARRAIALARYAGAERWSPTPFREAQQKLADAESGWQARVTESEVDLDARSATRLALRAEDEARTAKNAFDQREREKKSAKEIETAEQRAEEEKQRADSAEARVRELERELDDSKNRLTRAENELDRAKSEAAFLKPENDRLREENRRLGTERDEAKSRADRLEGELSVARNNPPANNNPPPGPTPTDGGQPGGTRPRNTGNDNPPPTDDGGNPPDNGNPPGPRVPTEEERRAALEAFKRSIERFGPVQETARGLTLILQESSWTKQTSAILTPTAAVQLENLAALLASNPEYQILIESFTDNVGQAAALRKLTQDRAAYLADRFTFAGVDNSRVTAQGLGSQCPVAPNTPKTRARNRRTEITFVMLPAIQ